MDFCLRSLGVQALAGVLYLATYVPLVAVQGDAAPDVSPGAAALALVRAEPDYVEGDELELSAHAGELAHAHSAIELRGLERRADGSYHYRGDSFVATIARNGDVQFRDIFFDFPTWRPEPSANPNPDALPSTSLLPPAESLRLFPFKMNLLAWLEKKLGNDPYLSERRSFMAQTRALRESLAERAEHAKLSSALAHVWTSAELSLAERKRETFEIWNESAPGEAGQAVRERVLAFIRERCPEGAACAFQPSELDELNKQRKHAEAFAPYAGHTEGGREDRPTSAR
jgi:hypothetical protein